MIHLITENGIACNSNSRYSLLFEEKEEFLKIMNDRHRARYLCKKCMKKAKELNIKP